MNKMDRTTFDRRPEQHEKAFATLSRAAICPLISRPFREKWENLSSRLRQWVWEIDRVILPRLTLRHAHGERAD